MNTINSVSEFKATVLRNQIGSLVAGNDDKAVVEFWGTFVGPVADEAAELLKEEELEAFQTRFERAKKALEDGEKRREAAAAKKAVERISAVVAKRGYPQVAAILEGKKPVEETDRDILVAVIRDKAVPAAIRFQEISDLLGELDGRIVDKSSWDDLCNELAEALEAFRQFREELSEVSRRMPGYATEQKLRAVSVRFFRTTDGLPPLVKALESLIVAKDRNDINDLLRTDPQLAASVATEPEGRQGGALLRALADRAADAVAANGRRRNGGVGAQTSTGKTASRGLSRDEREAKQAAAQAERAMASKAMRGHNETPAKHGKKK